MQASASSSHGPRHERHSVAVSGADYGTAEETSTREGKTKKISSATQKRRAAAAQQPSPVKQPEPEKKKEEPMSLFKRQKNPNFFKGKAEGIGADIQVLTSGNPSPAQPL